MKIVLATGGFDPIHSGHISYLRAARALGDKLIVGLNSDNWLQRKKGSPFMPFDERKIVLQNLEMVDVVTDFDDKDDTATHAIFKVLEKWKMPGDVIIFANGGDRKEHEIPEAKICRELNIEMRDGLGEKIRSSSELIKNNNEN